MEQMKNFFGGIQTLNTEQLVDILVAIFIYIAFRILSKNLSYITIKLFKPRANSKEIKSNSIYKTLRGFYVFLGLYLAILFLKEPLNITDLAMVGINKIFKIGIIVIVSNGLANLLTINSILIKKAKNRLNPDVEDATFAFLLKVVRGLIYIIAGFAIIKELGYDLSGLVTGLGIGTIVITLAAQDTAKNLFGGLAIFLDKPFIVGDWIQVGSFEGNVEDITFRSTRIRTFDNSVVNIPNASIANDSIINWSRMEKRRTKINLCLEFDTPLEKIQKVQKRIKEMLIDREGVIDETIMVKFDEIKENGINLLVYIYTSSVSYSEFVSEKEKINYNIMNILREEKVELAYDTKTIYVKK